MLPLRSSRSSTFPMSNLSYFASWTPSAMFSKSQNRAMLVTSGGWAMLDPGRAARPSEIVERAQRLPGWRNDNSNAKLALSTSPARPSMTTLPDLSLLETRILGVLVEKQHTVPDTYPLTLLSLTTGCNQKTSRDPIMNASESEVQAAIDRLKALSLVVESSGGRVMRYAH